MVRTPALKDITPEQAKLVQTDWDFVRTQSVEILYNFFDKYPGNMKHFKDFVGKDLEELKETPEFAIHAERIIGVFSQVVDLLGKDLDGIKKILNQMGENHRNRGTSKFSFMEFREALMEFLRFNVGSSFDGMEAWGVALDIMYHIIYNNLDGNPV